MIRNQVNGRVYVGSAIDLRSRLYTHRSDLRRGVHHSQRLQHAFNKYGEEAFTFEVLEPVSDVLQLLAREQHWMDTLQSPARTGYNICATAGNCLGVKHSEATRRKVSVAGMGRSPSAETRQRLSHAHKGRIFSEEARRKMSEAKRGMTPERKAEIARKISEAKRGRKATAEERAAMSAYRKGRAQSSEHVAKRIAATTETKRLRAGQDTELIVRL